MAGRGPGRSRRVDLNEPTAPKKVKTEVTISLREAYLGTKRRVQLSRNPLNGQQGQIIDIEIPPGIKSGHRIDSVTNQSGIAGLTVTVKVTNNEQFERRGDNLLYTTEVPLLDAILGGEATIPTMDDTSIVLTIPAETQNGRVFRLRGKGMPKIHTSEKGDFLITVKVLLPNQLSEREQSLYLSLREIRNPTNDRENR